MEMKGPRVVSLMWEGEILSFEIFYSVPGSDLVGQKKGSVDKGHLLPCLTSKVQSLGPTQWKKRT